jgi:hypothetical protein
MKHTLDTYRVVFKRDIDSWHCSREFVKAKSSLMAQWKIQDKFDISGNLIMSISLWRKAS